MKCDWINESLTNSVRFLDTFENFQSKSSMIFLINTYPIKIYIQYHMYPIIITNSSSTPMKTLCTKCVHQDAPSVAAYVFVELS
mmetsp:Transcript_1929/g.3438  ORF Transcript_1929/g.3438 Transcript_1929/m.3438 type:complete len:84 (+) Transcript_1929:1215-1466(+)